MPMSGPPKQPKKKTPPAPPEGVDYGDGELIPPMPPYEGGPAPTPGMVPGEYEVPGWATANPGANQGGGPGGMQSDIRSGIFEDLYRRGKRSGNDMLMNIGMPPMQPRPAREATAPPWEQGQEDPFYLAGPQSAQPPPMEQWPIHLQAAHPAMQQQNPGRRFPKATSLIPSASQPMRRGGY